MDNPTRLFDFPRFQLANGPLDVMMTMPNSGQPVTYSTSEFVEEMDRVSRGLISMGLASVTASPDFAQQPLRVEPDGPRHLTGRRH